MEDFLRRIMGNILKFEELYNAYLLCLKNKKRKAGTFNFVNSNLCENLINLLDSLNNRTYKPQASNCYVITDPALREIYAAQFRDRIVQHFYMKELVFSKYRSLLQVSYFPYLF